MAEIVVLLGAEIEFQEAYGRLGNDRSQDALEAEFDEALAHLSNFPHMSPVFRAPFRRMVLSGFPRAIYYTVEGDRVLVHAFVDTRQDPAAIFRRLGFHH